MKNSLRFLSAFVVASFFLMPFGLSQPKTGADQLSLESMALQWQRLPAYARVEGIEKLIRQYRDQIPVESDVARRASIVALIDAADSVKADSANNGLLIRFFSLYRDVKAPTDVAAVGREQDMRVAGLESANKTGGTSVTISPKDLTFWTGTIHSSWFDGYVKSDGEIWAGENIVATHFRGWVVFDLSPIPAGASITSIILNFWTSVKSNSWTHSLVVCAPADNCDPRTATGAYLYACMASSNWFTGATNLMQSTGGKSFYLNSSACADLQRRIGHDNWWALGIFESGDDDDWGVFLGHDNNLRPACTVAYTSTTSTGAAISATPTAFSLAQNYPNPFNPSTTVRYTLPQRSRVRLTVYNSLGEQVTTLVNGEEDGGYHEVKFDGTGLASGVYYYRLQAGGFGKTMSCLLMK